MNGILYKNIGYKDLIYKIYPNNCTFNCELQCKFLQSLLDDGYDAWLRRMNTMYFAGGISSLPNTQTVIVKSIDNNDYSYKITITRILQDKYFITMKYQAKVFMQDDEGIVSIVHLE